MRKTFTKSTSPAREPAGESWSVGLTWMNPPGCRRIGEAPLSQDGRYRAGHQNVVA